MAPNSMLLIASYLLLASALTSGTLTRASGFYPQPSNEPENYRPSNRSYPPYQMNGLANYNYQSNGRVRILLTRNQSNPNHQRLQAPEISYFGAIGVGTPAKMFNVVFDTGSSETWLPYYNWFPFANNLHYSDGFDCKDSTTCQASKRDYQFNYRGTTISGQIYDDRFTVYEDMLKDDAAFMVAPHISFSQNFLGISDASDEQFRYKPYDGVVGLAPVQQSTSGVRSALISLQTEQQRLMSEAGLMNSGQQSGPVESGFIRPNGASFQSSLIFSLWFNPNQNSRHGGELMLGGIDENRFSGDIFFHRLLSWFDWQVQLTMVTLGGQVVSCSNGCRLSLDTGANSLVGPRQDVEFMYDELQVKYDQDSGLWLIDCSRMDQLPAITFRIDDMPYALYPMHYVHIFRFREAIVCHMALKPWDKPDWLVGTSFISAYYTVFDFANRRIGFASPRG